MNILSKATIAAALLTPAFAAGGQEIPAILDSIRANNISLRALAADNEAAGASLDAANTLAGPSAEYSPFWAKDVTGVSSSELVVSQEFDFPTLYGSRRRAAALEREAMARRYDAARRDILLQAKLKCLELARANQERELLDRRTAYADEIHRLVGQLEAAGAATALDINKAAMDLMSIRAERAQNEAARTALLRDLRALNGDKPLDADSIVFPAEAPLPPFGTLRQQLIDADADIAAARAETAAAAQEVALSRQSWLPSLRAGYRRNTSPGESQNGFIVGLSFPVWSNRHQVRAATARRTAAQLRAEDAELAADNLLRSQYDRLTQLRATIDAYDPALLQSTLALLAKAVEAGTLPVLDYYTESNAVYARMQELIAARYEYQTLLADLTRNLL